jgi:hypothetical protein
MKTTRRRRRTERRRAEMVLQVFSARDAREDAIQLNKSIVQQCERGIDEFK